ncbi:hypothetical protein GW17_00055690 [Ensete ventricosum]|nr:hypothetical protein GW17_00055690 [Ensete ventricosum]
MQSSQSTLLDPEGYSGECIGKGSRSSKCICGGRIRHKLFNKTEYSKGDGGLRNFQWEVCKEESCSNRTDIQEG